MSDNESIERAVDSVFWSVVENIPKRVRQIQGVDDVNPFTLADKYFGEAFVADVSIDPNANINGKSPTNFQSEIFKPLMKLRGYYEIWKRMVFKYGQDEANTVLKLMLDGTLYFHDITKTDIPYCYAFDTSFLMHEGRPYGWLPGGPPRKSASFIGELVETTMDYSQQFAGAIGVPNILVNLAYYTRKEREQLHKYLQRISNPRDAILAIAMFISGLGYSGKQFKLEFETEDLELLISNYYVETGCDIVDLMDMAYDKYTEDLIQQFVHVCHNTFRVGGDSPFTNISVFDKHFISTFLKDSVYPDLSHASDNADEIIRLQRVFIGFFVEGSPLSGKKYKFPVGTVNIKKWDIKDYESGMCSFDQVGRIADEDFYDWVMTRNLKRGTFNIHIGEKVATCCRLTQSLSDLKKTVRQDTFGNGGIAIGSTRVVLSNLHRVALLYAANHLYEMNSPYCWDDIKSEVFDYIEYYMDKSKKALIVHKELLKERISQGFLQFFNIKWTNINQFFCTFGYTALWDAYRVLFPHKNPKDDVGHYIKVCGDILDFMDGYAQRSGEELEDYAFNLEEVPGENACVKLKEIDDHYFSRFEWYKSPMILSNQMVPLYEEMPLFDRLKIAGELMNKVSGGSILHLNINEEMTVECYKEFNRMMIEEYNIPHYAINRGSTTCVNGHTSVGIHWSCPVCDAEIYTHTIRIIGYDADTVDWPFARKEEFTKRIFYTAQDILQVLPQTSL